ncbi:uncharacterized protein MYCGRDRAFT_51173 [Zymoseptoria tritici IPO323]|uniref:Tc1-like transposase DDE domain-containing protein n=1 Tax=Zymoseptoria tritici (strain CBS 115943 / IPO323) TaxID=336722 RepID=F9XQ45_ZYMTI|nr:uncharacterized protein MYCGRDRAFT_51173 [Zymoseptoria tritici IPO323]EGP82577.1 hypothetical protein MYCGRDRAFT_51173 [Zymoseptoria tritici IPO323]
MRLRSHGRVPSTPRRRDGGIRKEHPTPKRSQAIILHQIAVPRHEIFDLTDIPRRTQQYQKSKGLSERRMKTRRGAQRAISTRTLRKIIAWVSESFEHRTVKWQELKDHFHLGCNERTLRNTMHAAGYHKCKACQKSYLRAANVDKRKAFCATRLFLTLDYWKSVRFTDEVHFCVEARRAAMVIRNHEERECETCIQFNKRNTTSVFHCWAMVGWDFKSELVFYNKGGNLTQQQYLYRIFKPHIEPVWRQHVADQLPFILEEDNDGSHGTRSTDNDVHRYKMSLQGFLWYANSPQSPDLSVIENVWRILKQRVKSREPTTKDELRCYIIEEWANITQDEINKLVLTMPQRIHDCFYNDGLHTSF